MPWVITSRGRNLKANGKTYSYGDSIPEECAKLMKSYVTWREYEQQEQKEEEQQEKQKEELQPEKPEDLLTHKGGGNYELPDGSVVKGKARAIQELGKNS